MRARGRPFPSRSPTPSDRVERRSLQPRRAATTDEFRARAPHWQDRIEARSARTSGGPGCSSRVDCRGGQGPSSRRSPYRCEKRRQAIHQLLKPVRRQRLSTVAKRLIRPWVHFEQEPIRSASRGGERHGDDEVAVSGGVGGVDDYREPSVKLRIGHRREIERVAQLGLKRSDSALAENDLLVAAVEEVLRGEKPLLDGGAESALQHDRAPFPGSRSRERQVLHVAGAYLEEVYPLQLQRDLRDLHHFSD